jgi:hypothetical protein
MISWILNFRPSAGFVTASFGINFALSIYRPMWERIYRALSRQYLARAVTIVEDAKPRLNEMQRIAIKAREGRLKTGLKSLAERSIKEAQRAAFVFSVLSMFCLFFDWINATAAILPLVPVAFAVSVYYWAKIRFNTFLRDVKGYVAVCTAPNGEIERDIGKSLS